MRGETDTAKLDGDAVAWHLSPEGLSGEVLDDLVRSAGISRRYRGVELAANLAGDDDNHGDDDDEDEAFTMIVNIAGEHWATAHVKPGSFALYADSYGLPANEHLQRFFTSRCRVSEDMIWHNARRIQALDSNYCGLFAALFALHFDEYGAGGGRRRRRGSRPLYKWETRSSRLGTNDKRCYNYLMRYWM